jgi:excisionase family DNA binding protein
MSDYLTIKEAAAYAKASERTIRRWIARGDLAAFRIGPKMVRIEQVDLDRLTRPIPNARS